MCSAAEAAAARQCTGGAIAAVVPYRYVMYLKGVLRMTGFHATRGVTHAGARVTPAARAGTSIRIHSA